MKNNRNNWLVQQQRRQDIASRGKRAVTASTPHEQDVIIADLSSSMSDRAFEGKTRYECLQTAVKPFKGRVQVIAFNTEVWEVDADKLPGPSGTTNMDAALNAAEKLEPLSVLLISDGEPNSDSLALEAATKLAERCIINTLYIGPEHASRAIEIMKEIARIGRGRFRDFRIDKESPALLESKIDQLLALPNPGSIQL